MKKVFITGIGSGLGKAFVKVFLENEYKVYALGRHLPDEFIGKIKFEKADLLSLENVYKSIENLLYGINAVDIVILNAGLLTPLKDIHDTPIYEMNRMMDINVWANKIILDYIIDKKIKTDQIIAISSGASVNGNRGWHGYSISKAALNMLIKLYSREMENTHLIALAPGLILTPMLEEFVLSADEKKFPSVKRIKQSPKMTPEEAAKKIFNLLPKLKEFESGSYVDIRKIRS
ncbi:alcohol dehydrogenase [Persephonella hydrogeniphila]|uniref:Alcohol dehydrogenase n=1 Tax=Persephonella hydrogeniphila TaxID=198703 RepID=A0A285NJR6_9AQUI|nr:SDR family NAD(P)-dependent oxidoreductase [Persephonella hydrogeniphila]SNZ09183.1 alcohol dehydrogenase [Persephonella hydrogeniphila]